jgi:hypothetical protein
LDHNLQHRKIIAIWESAGDALDGAASCRDYNMSMQQQYGNHDIEAGLMINIIAA